MRTCFDQNRLVSQTDRRFHATDIELAGGYVQIVPAVAARMTPQVRVGAWSFTETTLHQAEQIEVVRRNLPHPTRQAEAERRAMIEAHPSVEHEAGERPVAEHESGCYHW